MKNLLKILAIVLFTLSTNAQVGIGTATPDASAMLDVSSINKGLLLPRLTTAARTGISTPAAGLQVYDTDTNSVWFYNGTIWTEGTGVIGPAGADGADGAQGPKGDTGDAGADGATGAQGPKGDTGDTGAGGATGAQGPKGDTGDAGADGATGAQGLKGDTGDAGADGATGAQGPKGDTGDAGADGATGAQGPKGDTGDTGATGPAGDPATDDQDLTLTGNTLAISGDPNTDVDLSSYLDNTDDQDLTLTGNTLAISGDPNTDVDLSTYLDNTDDQTATEVTITDTADNFTATNVEGALTELATAPAESLYATDGTLSANRNVVQNNFDLNFDANTLVVSGDDDKIGIGTNSPTYKLEVSGVNSDASINSIRVGKGAGDISTNTAIGASALTNNTSGYSNTANGFETLFLNTTGNRNTANGHQALYSNTSGEYNTAIGRQALYNNTSGQKNTAIGFQSLSINNIGVENTAIGHLSLKLISNGSYNVALGNNAGNNITSGSSNIVIGNDTGVTLGTGDNQLNIGDWIYGDDGDIGIGIVAPTEKLHVDGNILVTGTGSITPDYVFQKYYDGVSSLKDDYTMMSLKEIEEFTKLNKHLPGVPSYKEVEEKGGIVLNRASEIQLEKIEELFLHTIEQQKTIEALKLRLEKLEKQIKN